MAGLNSIMENEIWKPITKLVTKTGDFYPVGYDVSNYGRLRSYRQRYGRGKKKMISTPTLLNGRPDPGGYTLDLLYDANSQRRNFRRHVLVMQTFVGIPESGKMVCHYDDIKTNNNLSNLRYGTYSENGADRKRNKKIQESLLSADALFSEIHF